MTKKEVLKVLAICREIGIQFVNSDNNILVGIWYKSFEKDRYEEVSRALFELINTKKSLFLNGLIGEIKAQMLTHKIEFMDFSMVWELIREAAHKTHPDIPQETIQAFTSLPPMIQHLVGSAKHLEEMEYCLDRNMLETVEKSNLKKLYAEMVVDSKNQMLMGKVPAWKRLKSSEREKLDKEIIKLLENKNIDKDI